MMRDQINVTLGERLKAALRFSAERDGISISTKARQILHQQLTRTMASAEFVEWLAGQEGASDAT
jgi:plasmid stability protein